MEILLPNKIGCLGISENDESDLNYSVFVSKYGYDFSLKIGIKNSKFYFYFKNLIISISITPENNYKLIFIQNSQEENEKDRKVAYFIFKNDIFVTEIDGIEMFIGSTNICLDAILLPITEYNKSEEIEEYKCKYIIEQNENFIVKMGTFEEYSNLELMKIEGISCEMISFDERIEIKKRIPSFDKLYIKITMPIVKGITLYDYFKKFGNFSQLTIELYSCTNIYLKFIPISIILNLCKLMIDFYYIIKELNDDGIYHNDLHFSNLIYNEELNTISMIDYGELTTGEPVTAFKDSRKNKLYDLDVMIFNIKFILMCGCLNIDFFEQLKDFGIIQGNEYCFNMFIKDNFISQLILFLR